MTQLKVSTATTVPVGPFTDSSGDYLTSLSNIEVKLKKGTAAWGNASGVTGTAMVYRLHGMYDLYLDTTDTNTVGQLDISISADDALPVFDRYFVVAANVYDTLVGTDNLDVTVAADGLTAASIADDAFTADHFDDACFPAAVFGADCFTDAVFADACFPAVVFGADCFTSAVFADDCFPADVFADDCFPAAVFADACFPAAVFGADCFTDANFAEGAVTVEFDTSTLLLSASNFDTGCLTAAAFAADALDDGVMSDALAQAVADKILSRGAANTEATADEFSLTDVILAMLNWTNNTGSGQIDTYRTDRTTVHRSYDRDSDASAEVITSLNPAT